MKCLFCKKYKTKVIDSRTANKGLIIRRRRLCLKCKGRFTTYEQPEQKEIYVVKKDGRKELFNRDKIKEGLMVACNKRPVTEREIENLVQRIERNLHKNYRSEFPSKIIGDVVMEELKKMDKIAYVRFASVCREFENLQQFVQEAKGIKSSKRR